MEPFKLVNDKYFIIEDWTKQQPHLVAGFTTKNEGRSEGAFSTLNLGFHVEDSYETVVCNRTLVGEELGIPIENWVGAEQTHEVRIQKVTTSDRGKGADDYEKAYKGTDGFFTYDQGVLLTLCYADCVPLYFFHPKTKAIGVAHAGWKGTVHGIASEMIHLFNSEGIPSNEISVVIGPAICEKCYIVDERVIQFVENRLEDVERKPYNLISEGQFQLNLKQVNKFIIKQTGVLEENIQVTDLCTSCHQDYFFSHRRDEGHTGRMMSFIGWKEDSQR
ncbi:peptidoglycan editing factor PgeF [Cytobacillus spongiae]|uniref:peptidoglycan editing factor PgeF n=1 Tax=Cytobacillus spongiae TaxID=2901381 RepID=UPI001F314633|nr:peptidoglycan editing factor PgeF [Cytobacillus spongiae]UII57333.1 peptidoglycan editing factor PgeF [Cytobacillus spongiae]